MVRGSDEFAVRDGGALRISGYRRLCSMDRGAAFLSMVLVAAAAAGVGISGVASVTDGDTLRIGSERIRLHGIDAPESKQSYRVPAFCVRLMCLCLITLIVFVSAMKRRAGLPGGRARSAKTFRHRLSSRRVDRCGWSSALEC